MSLFNRNNKKIYIVIGIILIVIIGVIILNKILKINLHFGFNSNHNEKYAICSDNSNTIEYIQTSSNKVHIKYTSHSNNSVFNDEICSLTKKIAYTYDNNAYIECNNEDAYASYYRKDSFENVINEYKNNNTYHCLTYEDEQNTNKNKIIGSWCGYNYNDTDLKYTFNNDGTIEMNNLGTNYKGYYEIKTDNNISYGTFLTNSDYYFVLLDDNFYYDENEDKIILNSKMTDDKYNIFTRCN